MDDIDRLAVMATLIHTHDGADPPKAVHRAQDILDAVHAHQAERRKVVDLASRRQPEPEPAA